MNVLNLSENIVRLRRERKITQEELADFIGVTKASVSKWENRQSTPDILLLPKLASFFGVTIDRLMGYEAQLSREQIRRCYNELSEDFAKIPFSEAMKKVRSLTHKYYSCYPLLLQICVLYLNHFMLVENENERREILQEAVLLCDHILDRCSDMGICGDALSIKATLNLQLGKTDEVIEALAPVSDPTRLSSNNDALLIQAYQMAGKLDDAKSHTQITMYLHLLNLIANAILDLALYGDQYERCEETIRRTSGIIALYHIDQLHPNAAAQFYYQMAVIYMVNEKNEEALKALGCFEKCVSTLLKDRVPLLHGDSYFDRLNDWIERLPLGEQAPRDKAFVGKSIRDALDNPLFVKLRAKEEFRRIYRHITSIKTETAEEENKNAEN